MAISRPRPCAIILGANVLNARSVPIRLTSTMRCHSAVSTSIVGGRRVIPAALNTTATLPDWPTVTAHRALTPPHRRARRVAQPRQRLLAGDIAGNPQRAAAARLDLRRHLVDQVL